MFNKDLIFILTTLLFLQLNYTQTRSQGCSPSSCGKIPNISYPFRLTNDPQNCGDRSYELVCEDNTTLLYLDSYKYLVKAIDYQNYTILLVDSSIIPNDTCSFPNHSLSLTHDSAYSMTFGMGHEASMISPIIFLSCPNPLNNSRLVQTDFCFNRSNNLINDSISSPGRHSYVLAGNLYVSDLREMCTSDVVAMTSMPFRNPDDVSLEDIHASLLYGFHLSWFSFRCPKCRGRAMCYLRGDTCVVVSCSNSDLSTINCVVDESLALTLSWLILSYVLTFLMFVIGVGLSIRIVVGLPALLVILIYRYRTRHLSRFNDIEGFLQDQSNLAPIRYSYSDIKRMTRNFRQKLGQGGFGSVYKGKLRSGHDIAVKTLKNIKSNGQDFINEVATIGRIHHTNVVKLVGYCVENSMCALVYDFMPNGSLDKYISSRELSKSLDWKRKYEIAVAIGKGIDYLHRGCDVKILHFDIKPHNILLDNEFNPKISDFGLAKFYSTKNSIVALTAARGTIGYVAPELINQSLGPVSHKADVYSFGMLLMDMLGLKGNAASDRDDSENSSKYFPNWIYDWFEKGKDIVGDENGDEDEEVRNVKKKMVIVALWCIQMCPMDRPSMREVVEMLEGEGGGLKIPPRGGVNEVVKRSGDEENWGSVTSDSSALLYGYGDSSSGLLSE